MMVQQMKLIKKLQRLKDKIQFEKKSKKRQEKMTKSSIKTIVTIVIKTIIIITLITKIKLSLLLSKNRKKVFYPTPIFISSIKHVSKQIMPCGSYYNIEKYYLCFLLKLMPRANDKFMNFLSNIYQ